MLRFFECNLFCMAVQNSSAGWSQFSLSLGSNTRRMVHSEEQSQSAWSGVTWGHWADPLTGTVRNGIFKLQLWFV